jgi:hypothetical protein
MFPWPNKFGRYVIMAFRPRVPDASNYLVETKGNNGTQKWKAFL